MDKATARYFETLEELQVIAWMLSQMAEDERRLSSFDRLIDKQTGYDKEKERQAKKLMRRADVLKRRLEAVS